MRPIHYACAVSALLLGAPSASASILTFTYTGIVSYGTDSTGVFGPANTDLAKQTFVVVERFDTATFKYANTDGSTFSYQQGGSSYGAGGATATLSIGGSAPRPIADIKDSVQNTTGVSTTSFQDNHSFINADNAVDFHDESLSLSAYAPAITYDYTVPFSLSAPTAAFTGTYALSSYVRDITTGSYTSFEYAFATLQPASLTVTNTVSTVPLPGTLPLLGAALCVLAGAGLLRNGRQPDVRA